MSLFGPLDLVGSDPQLLQLFTDADVLWQSHPGTVGVLAVKKPDMTVKNGDLT